ncbi:MAG: DUF5117 domain-containing protein, partial [Thermoanaerobaculia bacterium]
MRKNFFRCALAPVLLLLSALAFAAPEETPSISQRAAGLSRHDGFVSYYWDAHKGALLLEIPTGSGDFLYGSGLASGTGMIETFLDRGQPGNLGLCHFERVGPKVLLIQKQTTNRSGDPDPERTRVVEESFPTSILAALPVVAEEGDRVLVDATEFLLRDTEVLPILRQAHQGDWKQATSLSALNFERTGAFPKNTEIEAQLTFVSDNPSEAAADVLPDGRTMTLRIHHSFVQLPDPGYT